jgi:hypothetical protein
MNQSRGSFNLAKVTDSLNRTDHILARNILDMVQQYYTEPRIINVTQDRLTNQTEQVMINQVDPATGEILNDLTIGEYDVVVTSTPVRETLEDSQFQQALALRELGIPIPDETLLENSRLLHKSEIIEKMKAAAQSPEAMAQAELEKMAAELSVAKSKAETARLEADALLKQSKADKENMSAQKAAAGDSQEEMAKFEAEMAMAREKHELEMEQLRAELVYKQREYDMKLQQMQEQSRIKVTQQQAQQLLSAQSNEE